MWGVGGVVEESLYYLYIGDNAETEAGKDHNELTTAVSVEKGVGQRGFYAVCTEHSRAMCGVQYRASDCARHNPRSCHSQGLCREGRPLKPGSVHPAQLDTTTWMLG